MGVNVCSFSRRTSALGRQRKFGGCDPAGIQGCISHDESLVLVYSTAERSTELGSHESRTAEAASTTLSMTLKALRSRYFVRRMRWMMRAPPRTSDFERRAQGEEKQMRLLRGGHARQNLANFNHSRMSCMFGQLQPFTPCKIHAGTDRSQSAADVA